MTDLLYLGSSRRRQSKISGGHVVTVTIGGNRKYYWGFLSLILSWAWRYIIHLGSRTSKNTHTKKSLFYVSFFLFFVFISAAASLGIQILSSKAQDLFFFKQTTEWHDNINNLDWFSSRKTNASLDPRCVRPHCSRRWSVSDPTPVLASLIHWPLN